MSKVLNRSAHSEPENIVSAWRSFWFAGASPFILHSIRIAFGAWMIVWMISWGGYRQDLYGRAGWFDREGFKESLQLGESGLPVIRWSPIFQLDSPGRIDAAFGLGLTCAILFTLGIATRWTSVGCWLCVITFTSNPAIWNGIDVLAGIISLYLMVGYLFSFDANDGGFSRVFGSSSDAVWNLLRKSENGRPSISAGLACRLMQVHLALVMLGSGLHKLQLAGWWSGVALWFPLHPPFESTMEKIVREYPNPDLALWLMSLGCYAVMVWQLAFPVFAFSPRGRWLAISGAAIAWIGNQFLFGLPSYGPLIFIMSLSFIPSKIKNEVQSSISEEVAPSLVVATTPKRPVRSEERASVSVGSS